MRDEFGLSMFVEYNYFPVVVVSTRKKKKSKLIEAIQYKLKKLGFYEGKIDGYYSWELKMAILGFQKRYREKYHLKLTGYLDPKTLNAIDKEYTKLVQEKEKVKVKTAPKAMVKPEKEEVKYKVYVEKKPGEGVEKYKSTIYDLFKDIKTALTQEYYGIKGWVWLLALILISRFWK